MEVGLAGTDAPEGEAAGTGLPPVEDAVAGERSTPVEMTGGQPAEDGAAPTEAADRVPAGAVEEASVEEPLAEAGEVPAEEDASAAEAVGAEQPPEPAGEPSMAAPSSPAVLEPAGEEPTAATVEGPDAEAEEQEQEQPPDPVGVPAAEAEVGQPLAPLGQPSAEAPSSPAVDGSGLEGPPGPAAAETEASEPPAGAEAMVPAGPGSPVAGPPGPVRASSMDSTTLPDRSRHDEESRRQRHRRSAARLPALVTPVDIPEDAEGRVDIMVTRADPDRDEPGLAEPVASAPGGDLVRDLLTMGSGWVAVGGLAALLIVVFVVLELLYR